MRRLIGLAGILILLWLVFQRKEGAASSKFGDASRTDSGSSVLTSSPHDAGDGSGKPTKVRERLLTPGKRFPIAEPVPDKPGHVKSPFSGRHLYIGSIPAGKMVVDPFLGPELEPGDLGANFRIPEGASEPPPSAPVTEKDDLLKRMKAPEGAPVPGKPGFIFDPYDQSLVDVTAMTPGTIFSLPGSISPRYIRVPGGPPMDSAWWAESVPEGDAPADSLTE
jgi:hypothetical protein